MRRRSTAHEYSSVDIRLDIAGVGPDSKLGELTVRQFTQLLLQLTQQLNRERVSTAKKNAARNMAALRNVLNQQPAVSAVEKLVRQTRDRIAELSAKGALPTSIVRETQDVILKSMPGVFRQGGGRSK
jgi:hypothetical protein